MLCTCLLPWHGVLYLGYYFECILCKCVLKTVYINNGHMKQCWGGWFIIVLTEAIKILSVTTLYIEDKEEGKNEESIQHLGQSPSSLLGIKVKIRLTRVVRRVRRYSSTKFTVINWAVSDFASTEDARNLLLNFETKLPFVDTKEVVARYVYRFLWRSFPCNWKLIKFLIVCTLMTCLFGFGVLRFIYICPKHVDTSILSRHRPFGNTRYQIKFYRPRYFNFDSVQIIRSVQSSADVPFARCWTEFHFKYRIYVYFSFLFCGFISHDKVFMFAFVIPLSARASPEWLGRARSVSGSLGRGSACRREASRSRPWDAAQGWPAGGRGSFVPAARESTHHGQRPIATRPRHHGPRLQHAPPSLCAQRKRLALYVPLKSLFRSYLEPLPT